MTATDTRPAPCPVRPVLRPGAHVLRRSEGELQVGLDWHRALVLPDREPYRSTLRALAHPATPGAERSYDPRVLALLDEAGLLVEVDPLLALMPPAPADDAADRLGAGRLGAGDLAALAARAGDDAPRLVARRSRAVEVLTHGGAGAGGLADQLVALLRRSGCPATRRARCDDDVDVRVLRGHGGGRRDLGSRPGQGSGRGPGGDRAGEAPAVGVLVSLGEPPREMADPWLRDGTPYTVLRLSEGHAVLGPFAVPGQTACLRCVDAHLTDVDPAWPLLALQYAAACATTREDALVEPCDPSLAALSAAWTARDVLTHLEDGSPSTASGTVRVGPVLSTIESQTWSRHPCCGCAWD